MKHRFLILLAMAVSMTSFAQQKLVSPKTARGNTVDTYFGVKVADPYRWLENDTSAATAAWVVAQNRVTSAYLSKVPFRKALLKRFTGLANYEKIGIPFKERGK